MHCTKFVNNMSISSGPECIHKDSQSPNALYAKILGPELSFLELELWYKLKYNLPQEMFK